MQLNELCRIEHSLCNWTDLMDLNGKFKLQSCVNSKRALLKSKRNVFRIVSMNEETGKPDYKLAECSELSSLLNKWKKLEEYQLSNDLKGFGLAKEGAKALLVEPPKEQFRSEDTLESLFTRISQENMDKILKIYGTSMLVCLLIARLCDTSCFIFLSIVMCIGLLYTRNKPFYLYELLTQVSGYTESFSQQLLHKE